MPLNPHSCLVNEEFPYRQANCESQEDDKEYNRIGHFALIKQSALASINTSTLTTFMTTLLAAELAGDAIIIRSVNGTKAEPTAITGVGTGFATETITGKTHTVNIIDTNYHRTVRFYNAFEKNPGNYGAFYFTSKNAFPIPAGKMSAFVKDPITDDFASLMAGNMDITWSERSNPVPIPFDSLQLAQVPELFDVSTMDFVNDSGSTASVSGNQISETTATAFDVTLETTKVLSQVRVVSGKLPTGVLALIDPTDNTKLAITGSSTQIGIHKAVIEALNPSGVYTNVPVTVQILAA